MNKIPTIAEIFVDDHTVSINERENQETPQTNLLSSSMGIFHRFKSDHSLDRGLILDLSWFVPLLIRNDFMREVIRRLNLLFLLLIAISAGLIFGGCKQTTYTFKVDAINNQQLLGNLPESYKLVSAEINVEDQPLIFEETSDYIKTALSGKGYYEAPDPEQAEMVVAISCGVGGPQTTSFKRVRDPVIGSSTMVEESYYPVTTYEKHLRMESSDIRQLAENKRATQVWSVDIRYSDENSDLKKYIPIMAAAAIPCIGEKTNGQEEIIIKETDPAVSFIKEGI